MIKKTFFVSLPSLKGWQDFKRSLEQKTFGQSSLNIFRVHFFDGDDLEEEIELLFKACDKYKKNNGLICGSHHLVS